MCVCVAPVCVRMHRYGSAKLCGCRFSSAAWAVGIKLQQRAAPAAKPLTSLACFLLQALHFYPPSLELLGTFDTNDRNVCLTWSLIEFLLLKWDQLACRMLLWQAILFCRTLAGVYKQILESLDLAAKHVGFRLGTVWSRWMTLSTLSL